jgi:hypothetical protein
VEITGVAYFEFGLNEVAEGLIAKSLLELLQRVRFCWRGSFSSAN